MFITKPKSQSATPDTSTTDTALPLPPEVLKTQPAWERVFSGQAQGSTFELRLQKDETGLLHGHCTVTPGKPEGWHLTGQVQKDNSFTLKGTENEALFEGSFSENATSITASFRNKEVQVERLVLQRQLSKIKRNAAESQEVFTPAGSGRSETKEAKKSGRAAPAVTKPVTGPGDLTGVQAVPRRRSPRRARD